MSVCVCVCMHTCLSFVHFSLLFSFGLVAFECIFKSLVVNKNRFIYFFHQYSSGVTVASQKQQIFLRTILSFLCFKDSTFKAYIISLCVFPNPRCKINYVNAFRSCTLTLTCFTTQCPNTQQKVIITAIMHKITYS